MKNDKNTKRLDISRFVRFYTDAKILKIKTFNQGVPRSNRGWITKIRAQGCADFYLYTKLDEFHKL